MMNHVPLSDLGTIWVRVDKLTRKNIESIHLGVGVCYAGKIIWNLLWDKSMNMPCPMILDVNLNMGLGD
jgi:hypothetical protein